MILDKISEKIDITKYQIPQIFFVAPSIQLRSEIRKGPQIKTKEGERTNLYIPFSFVKASECTPMPEVTRKNLTDAGSACLKALDSINKFPVKLGSKRFKYYEEYLQTAYSLSDEIRKRWRLDALHALNSGNLKTWFEADLFDIFNSEKGDEDVENFLQELKQFTVAFAPVRSSPEEQRSLVEQVHQRVETRQSQRVKPR